MPRPKGGDMKNFRLFLCVISLLFFAYACTDSKGQKQEPVFKQVPEIQEVKPDKPVKIKLKRNAKNDYSWEINGDDVEEIIKAEKTLRKELKTE